MICDRRILVYSLFAILSASQLIARSIGIQLNKKEYFEAPGINVMAFQDIYPDGSSGRSVNYSERRTCGDER